MKCVLKLGGAVLTDEAQLAAIGGDVAALRKDGATVVIVHGGGPQATALSKKLGIEPNIVGGRRITDADTLEVCKMVYAGQLSVDLVSALRQSGVPAVGLSGASGLIHAEKRPPRVVSGGGEEPIDFGHVGDITGVNEDLLGVLLGGGYVPVINSLGADESGRPFNINADICATRIASVLKADHLGLLAGGVPGVLKDKDDVTTRIPSLTAKEARAAIKDGTIQGGMIPKIEESLGVIESGVGAIHILGTLEPGQLSAEFEKPGSVGTALLP
jgi:acetylglutamate kinase